MKRQIRLNVFETNSSSTHSIVICSQDEYDDFLNGKIAINMDSDEFRSIEELSFNEDDNSYFDPSRDKDHWDNEYRNYEQYTEANEYLEPYECSYTTKSGDKIVAFGYYGHD